MLSFIGGVALCPLNQEGWDKRPQRALRENMMSLSDWEQGAGLPKKRKPANLHRNLSERQLEGREEICRFLAPRSPLEVSLPPAALSRCWALSSECLRGACARLPSGRDTATQGRKNALCPCAALLGTCYCFLGPSPSCPLPPSAPLLAGLFLYILDLTDCAPHLVKRWVIVLPELFQLQWYRATCIIFFSNLGFQARGFWCCHLFKQLSHSHRSPLDADPLVWSSCQPGQGCVACWALQTCWQQVPRKTPAASLGEGGSDDCKTGSLFAIGGLWLMWGDEVGCMFLLRIEFGWSSSSCV